MLEHGNHRLFNNRFYVERKISSGGFGIVFLCKDLQKLELQALKVEKCDANGRNSLAREIMILERLQKIQGIPELIWFGKEHGHNCFVQQYLGKDLAYRIKEFSKFSLKCTVNIGLQLLNILEAIHKKGVVHRDLKPENIMTGRDKEDDVIYLADFGISKIYRDVEGKHIRLSDTKQFVGTTRYASLNAHKGYELSRRDDLESLGYVLVFLLKGKLPWQRVNLVGRTIDKANQVGELKELVSLTELCMDIPNEFVKYFEYVRDLRFKECPDYRYLSGLLESIAKRFNFCDDLSLDWTESHTVSDKIRQSHQWYIMIKNNQVGNLKREYIKVNILEKKVVIRKLMMNQSHRVTILQYIQIIWILNGVIRIYSLDHQNQQLCYVFIHLKISRKNKQLKKDLQYSIPVNKKYNYLTFNNNKRCIVGFLDRNQQKLMNQMIKQKKTQVKILNIIFLKLLKQILHLRNIFIHHNYN